MTSDDSLFEEAKSDKDTRKAVQNQIAGIKNFVKGINIDEFKKWRMVCEVADLLS